MHTHGLNTQLHVSEGAMLRNSNLLEGYTVPPKYTITIIFINPCQYGVGFCNFLISGVNNNIVKSSKIAIVRTNIVTRRTIVSIDRL